MKLKKILAIGLSTVMLVSASPVYATETNLTSFEDFSNSVAENDEGFISFGEQGDEESISETENFSSGNDEQQIFDRTDDIPMVEIASDNRAPIIESITIDKHDVTIGDTVSVTAVITDESGIKSSPYIGFYMTESQVHTMYLKAQGDNIYKGSITITDDFVNGIYPAKWCNLEDIYSNGGTNYSFDLKYPDLYFCVNGAKEDNQAPIIENITIDKHDVTIGDTVTVTAVITDESGIKDSPYIGFYMTGSQVHTIYLNSQGNNIYKGSITITDDFVNGTYPAKWCNLEDIHSNGGTNYSFDLKYPDLYFCVNGAKEDNQAPIIENITIDKHDVKAGDTVTVTAVITDESGIKDSPYIGFYMTGSQVHTIYLKSQGNNIYKGSITITDDFVNGTYPAKWCNLEDIYSNGGTNYSFDGIYPNLYFRVLCDNHTWNQGVIFRNVTCTDNGEKQYICTVCGATKTEVIPAPGHKAVIDSAVTPSCETPGKTEGSHCSVCDEVLIPQDVISATGHSWDNGKITKEAACEENGIKTYTCAVCHRTKDESIPAFGHQEVVDSAVTSTCETDGKTEGSHCSVCDKVLVSQDVIPATGHTWDNGTITQEATCEASGNITYTCTTCGKTRNESIEALGHKEVIDDAIVATCETDGKTEGSHCSVCDKVLIPQDIISAIGHTWDDGVITKAATCENSGIKTYTCTICGKIKTVEISASGHKEISDPAIAATCESDGKTEGSHCSVCGKVFIEQSTIKATGHKEVADPVVIATCETNGKTEGSHCSICGKIIASQMVVPATGHNWNKGIITKSASCTKAGIITYTCVNCHETKHEEIPAVGHKYDSWKTSSSATVFAPEKQIRTCSECGQEEEKEVGSKLQETMKVSVTSIRLKVKQKTTVLKVSGLAEGDSIVSWKSNNTKVVTISGKTDGTCTIKAGKKIGKAKITIALKSGLQKSVNVYVQKSAVKTEKITGVAKTLKLKKKQKTVLHPIIVPFTSTDKVTFKSSNSKIVTVNSKGQITAKKKGTAIITVKSGSKTAKCKVMVR